MKLFISWSGDLSQRLALHLKAWLPTVLPFVEAWVSSEDIPKGARWGTELASQLGGTDSGIICLVPDNVNEAWLNFEAGALSKSVTEGRVHPFLFGLDPHDLVGPIGQFQATRFSKDDVHKLVKALNSETGIAAIGAHQLDLEFNARWPDLEHRLTPLAAEAACARPVTVEPPLDPSEAARELLLAGVLDARGIVRRVRTSDQGLCVETNQRNFVESNNPRSEARWAAAVDELHDLGLLEDRAGRGEWFFVTDAGYHAAERLGSK